ncbi:MAG TPA: hypothetical protein VFA70_08990 [Dehalococcoidia bacterium]|nr:hypothetical protein [Dehalococcoidia bacterium]
MVERLAALGFTGPDFDRFSNQLTARGLRVIDAWTRSRHIFIECRRKGIKLGDSVEWSEDDRKTLVQDSVHTGFRRFRTSALCQRVWDPGQGASLSTFFIGSCVYAFGDEYREWRDGEVARRLQLQQLATHLGVLPLPETQRVGAAVVDRMNAREALRKVAAKNPRLAIILALTAEGYEQQEIADLLGDGTTARAVEGALRRYRARRAGDGT